MPETVEKSKEVGNDKAPSPSQATGEDIRNLKAEFERKLGNIDKSNQALMAQLQAVVSSSKAPQQKPEEKKTPMKDIWYDDPERASDVVVDRATKQAVSVIQAEQQKLQKQGAVIQGLYREYPELQDFDNPLTIKAVERFNALAPDEQAHPMAYKLAVKEAAEELDIKPKMKRPKKEDGDAFSLSGEGGQGTGQKTRTKKGELNELTVQFAKHMGLNMDDEKQVESLKKTAQRTNWNRWE